MESRAISRHVRIAPQKARLVADLVRGKQVGAAIGILQVTSKKAARILVKTIKGRSRQRRKLSAD